MSRLPDLHADDAPTHGIARPTLTGDCEQDCQQQCAYPGQFSECDIVRPVS